MIMSLGLRLLILIVGLPSLGFSVMLYTESGIIAPLLTTTACVSLLIVGDWLLNQLRRRRQSRLKSADLPTSIVDEPINHPDQEGR